MKRKTVAERVGEHGDLRKAESSSVRGNGLIEIRDIDVDQQIQRR
jgi:hypothetical protein